MTEPKFKLRCRTCGFKLVHARRDDFEETGALFRHAAMRDKSEEYDADVGHTAEPVVIYPDRVSVDIWVSSHEHLDLSRPGNRKFR